MSFITRCARPPVEQMARNTAMSGTCTVTVCREQLSTLVNSLFGPSSAFRLDFLINGQFLRGSLEKYLADNGISAENTLDVEYVRALSPPEYVSSFEHDDWVGAVDVLSRSSPAGTWGPMDVQSGHERILTGSYDGLLRVWNMSGEVVATSTSTAGDTRVPHILSAKYITPSSIVSAGADMKLRLWKFQDDAASLTPELELLGHTMAINDVSVHGPSKRILSASTDSTAAFWSSDALDKNQPPAPRHIAPDSTSNKRRKVSDASSVRTAGPLATLVGHKRPVRAVIFHPNDDTVAYTASDDRTVQTWDLTTSASVSRRTPLAHTPVLSLAALRQLNLVAAGTGSRAIALVDPREDSSRSAVLTLTGHNGAVVTLASAPDRGHVLASGSHDGTVRVWDVRNTRGPSDTEAIGAGLEAGARTAKAVLKIKREGPQQKGKPEAGEAAKVFAVCWDGEVGIASAGEDKRVQVNRSDS